MVMLSSFRREGIVPLMMHAVYTGSAGFLAAMLSGLLRLSDAESEALMAGQQAGRVAVQCTH